MSSNEFKPVVTGHLCVSCTCLSFKPKIDRLFWNILLAFSQTTDDIVKQMYIKNFHAKLSHPIWPLSVFSLIYFFVPLFSATIYVEHLNFNEIKQE